MSILKIQHMNDSFYHIEEFGRIQFEEDGLLKIVREEYYQRFQTNFVHNLIESIRQEHIEDHTREKAVNMLSDFINKSKGIETHNPTIEFEPEDDDIQINIHKHNISVYLYYNEQSIGEENFDEAYLYYEDGGKNIITNNTIPNIAKIVSKLLTE